jgi:hypothetical protein
LRHAEVLRIGKFVAVLATVVTLLLLYIDYSTSLAIVRGGFIPGAAARDFAAFKAFTNLTEESPAFSRLEAMGRALVIEKGTRCRVLKHDGTTGCEGPPHHAVKVRIMDGKQAGQTVWMCSDSVQLLHHSP